MESEKYKEFKKVKKLNKIELFYCNLFNSFQALNKCFKKKHPRLLKYYVISVILLLILINIICQCILNKLPCSAIFLVLYV